MPLRYAETHARPAPTALFSIRIEGCGRLTSGRQPLRKAARCRNCVGMKSIGARWTPLASWRQTPSRRSGNGHPGTAMSLAPAAYLLFQKVMRHDPADVHWLGRDRFILSAGHSLADAVRAALPRRVRARARRPEGAAHLGLADPRPPRVRPHRRRRDHHRPARPGPRLRRRASPTPPATSAACSTRMPRPARVPFDHFIYVIAGDGDLQEGVTSEASSLAGHQQLGNLVVHLRLEPDLDRGRHQHRLHRGRRRRATRRTAGTCRPSTGRRPASTSRTSPSCTRAIEAAKGETDKPSIIILKTIIGWPSPGKQNTGKIHGSALGADELAATKKVLGFDPEQTFVVAEDVLEHTRAAGRARRRPRTPSGRSAFDAWAAANPERKALLDRLAGAASCPTDIAVRAARCSRPARRSRPAPRPAR